MLFNKFNDVVDAVGIGADSAAVSGVFELKSEVVREADSTKGVAKARRSFDFNIFCFVFKSCSPDERDKS